VVADGTFLDAVVEALRAAAAYDKNDQAPPAAVLWPDKSREWELLLPRIRAKLPVLTCDAYASEARSGPAVWLRCALAGEVDGVTLAAGETPIVYFPGVSRDELRSLEDMDPLLQPIAELQYRGAWWSHANGRDWTVAAFLSNKQRGLGLDLKDDALTLEALSRALARLADEPVEALRGRQLGPEDFDALLTPDSRRSMLLWLDDPEGFRAARDAAEWGAFCAVSKKELGIDPEGDGALSAAERLGGRAGAWAAVWARYAESPEHYPNVAAALDRARPHELILEHPDSWPSFNEEQEEELRGALAGLAAAQPSEARKRIADLEAQHGERRGWLWGCMGRAPLAYALEHLAALAEVAAAGWKQGDAATIAAQYAEAGWRADDAQLRSLAAVEKAEDAAAVKAASDVLYRVWLEEGAKALQEATRQSPPAALLPALAGAEPGTCVLFSDGLRMDVAQRLRARLEGKGCQVALAPDLAALPTVTPTGKAAVSPVAAQLTTGPDFDPSAPGAQSALNADGLRKLIAAAGWQVLGSEGGDPSGRAWTEHGSIDQFGHSHGWKLGRVVDAEVGEIAERVTALLAWGWQRVVVVTDHGWLLVPAGLEKVDLPEHLAEKRKGRCARLKPGVETEFLTLPWRFDPQVEVAYAPGLTTFVAGEEYVHGGISPQECVTPRLTVTRAGTAPAGMPGLEIAAVTWAGLRCRVQAPDAPAGVRLDVRTKAGDASSTLLAAPAAFADGKASGLVEDDELEGTAVFVVLLDEAGTVIKQAQTVVGGDG
jgi:hypothetical protein